MPFMLACLFNCSFVFNTNFITIYSCFECAPERSLLMQFSRRIIIVMSMVLFCFVFFFKHAIHISINQKSFTESSKESHECLAGAVLSSINRYLNGEAERLKKKTSCLSAKRVSLFSGLLSLSLFVTNYSLFRSPFQSTEIRERTFMLRCFSVVVVVVLWLFACSLESTCNISWVRFRIM